MCARVQVQTFHDSTVLLYSLHVHAYGRMLLILAYVKVYLQIIGVLVDFPNIFVIEGGPYVE
jgi:hypothetical protein